MPAPMVEIARFHDPVAAQIARATLEAAGVDAILLDAALSGLLGGAMPSRLMVEPRDERAARAVLDAR